MRARGSTPSAAARSALITSTAAAPSLIDEAFPAVTVPPSPWKAGRSPASASTVAPTRMLSSVRKAIGAPFRCPISTVTFSSSKRPAAVRKLPYQ